MAFGVLPGAGEPLVTDWEDVTSYVRKISIRAGRFQDLDRTEASTCIIELENGDARFTPENTTGAYYPDVRPFVQVEVSWKSDNLPGAFTLGQCLLGTLDSALYDTAPTNRSVFRGLVERWNPEWFPITGGICSAECVGLFRFLQVSELEAQVFVEQTAGARIAAVLTAINNPFPVSIDSAGATVKADTVTGNALEYIQGIADDDGGLFYERGDGKAVYIARSTLRASSTFSTSQATIGDGAGEINYRQLEQSMDEQTIINYVTGENSAGSEITAVQDTISQSYYLKRPIDLGTTDLKNTSDVTVRAVLELVNKSAARLRIDTLQFEILDQNIDSSTLVNLDLMTRVTVTRRPDQGSTLTGLYLVQGWEHDVTPESWMMNLRVSSAPAGVWELGVSALGTGTVLKY